ncbi:unnamed protein product [Caenorhabditis bovis]|uniref:PDZ domain-containing protein n=1 Tax=Caenorhabditis bovis TaxID=2654633 RepID=A0A8S1EYZ2_9PELO|nr:unnamed protein product [Caenorhabditis bovis]
MATNFHTKCCDEIVFDHKNVVVACDLNNGKVVHVDVSSELMGHVFAGDEILTVNGEGNIKTTSDFNKAIVSKAPGKIKIELMRDDHCLAEEKILPPRRPNTQLTEVSLKYRGGAATGIIIHRMSSHPTTVTISMVQSASSACKFVKSGDILVKVNDIYVMDRDAARKLLYASVNNAKSVVLTLERSTNDQPIGPSPPPPDGAKTTGGVMKSIMGSAPVSPASVISPSMMAAPKINNVNKQYDVSLPADVIEIMKANKDFFKKKCPNPPCLIKIKSAASTSAASMTADQPEVAIPCDPSPKPLRVTPKRVGS